MVARGVNPGSKGNQLGADGGVFVIVVDAIGGSLDADNVAGINEGLGGLRRDCTRSITIS